MRVLIVDDDFVSRRILQGVMAPHAECAAASDGAEAIEAFEAARTAGHPFDLVLLDVMMPRVDGLQTLAAIREKAPEVPVFMISALGDPRTVFDACYKGGATAYLVKPVRKEKLLAELRAFGLLPATGD